MTETGAGTGNRTETTPEIWTRKETMTETRAGTGNRTVTNPEIGTEKETMTETRAGILAGTGNETETKL